PLRERLRAAGQRRTDGLSAAPPGRGGRARSALYRDIARLLHQREFPGEGRVLNWSPADRPERSPRHMSAIYADLSPDRHRRVTAPGQDGDHDARPRDRDPPRQPAWRSDGP